MNANTRLRLWKETRALLPMWAAAVALMIGSGLVGAAFENHIALTCHIIAGIGGCWLLGAVSVGHEFDHRTMGMLLCQPVPRSRLWAEKMLVLSIAVGTLWWSVSIVSWLGLGYGMPSGEAVFSSAGILAIAICAAPVLTLLARSTIGGVALTLVGPFVLSLVTAAIATWVTIYRVKNNLIKLTHSKVVVTDHTPFFAALLIVYCGSLAWLGWRKFVRWEENQAASPQIALPASVARLLDGVRGRVSLGLHSAWGSLLRKELGIQQSTFLVALGLVAMWVALVAAVFARAAMDKGFLMLPLVLLCLGIPVIAGIVAVAEERSLGVHEWHLTLPVSARRQWGVKVLVALGVNAALGVLLPGLLAHASSWLANNPQLVAEIPGRNVSPFLIANAVIFCAALYASTASANGLRALVGTIGLFVAAGVTMTVVDRGIHWLPEDFAPMPDRTGWWPSPEILDLGFWFVLRSGWILLVVWLLALGFARFRRVAEGGWRPLLRLVPFFVTVVAFIGCMAIYGMWASHYAWTYYDHYTSHAWDRRQRAKQRLELTPPPPPNPQPGKPHN